MTKTTPDATALHTKYRPKTLDDVIGHEDVVRRLSSMVESGKWPSVVAFFGPVSSGKTTLARALATTSFGKSCVGHPDFAEVSLADERSIEAVRNLIGVSKLMPSQRGRRFLFLDEAQGVLSNAPAAAALLQALEQPPRTTTWILGSMSPDTFLTNQNGKAMVSRATQFHLKAPSPESLMKQALRITKGEQAPYLSKEFRAALCANCNGEMRTLANLMQSAIWHYEGLPEADRPATLTAADVGEVLQGGSSPDEDIAVRFMSAVYERQYSKAHREILDVQDGFGFIMKCLWLNWYVLNDIILKGQRHPKVWSTPGGRSLRKAFDTCGFEGAAQLRVLASVQADLTQLKAQAQAFAVPEAMALQRFAWDTIQSLKKV